MNILFLVYDVKYSAYCRNIICIATLCNITDDQSTVVDLLYMFQLNITVVYVFDTFAFLLIDVRTSFVIAICLTSYHLTV